MTFWTLVGAITLGMFGSDVLSYTFRSVLGYFALKSLRKKQAEFAAKMVFPKHLSSPYEDEDPTVN